MEYTKEKLKKIDELWEAKTPIRELCRAVSITEPSFKRYRQENPDRYKPRYEKLWDDKKLSSLEEMWFNHDLTIKDMADFFNVTEDSVSAITKKNRDRFPARNRNFWQEDKLSILQKHWNEDGLTANQCGEKMGVSAESVVNAIFRHKDRFVKRSSTPVTEAQKVEMAKYWDMDYSAQVICDTVDFEMTRSRLLHIARNNRDMFSPRAVGCSPKFSRRVKASATRKANRAVTLDKKKQESLYKIRDLSQKGYSPNRIASELGIKTKSLMSKARKNNITLNHTYGKTTSKMGGKIITVARRGEGFNIYKDGKFLHMSGNGLGDYSMCYRGTLSQANSMLEKLDDDGYSVVRERKRR